MKKTALDDQHRLDQHYDKRKDPKIAFCVDTGKIIQEDRIKRTYVLHKSLAKALDRYSAHIGQDKSDIVAHALRAQIPAKYFE